jgi:hypothetical protein
LRDKLHPTLGKVGKKSPKKQDQVVSRVFFERLRDKRRARGLLLL